MPIPTALELMQQLNKRLSDIERRTVSSSNTFDYKTVLIPLQEYLFVLPGESLVQAVDKMQRYITHIFAQKIDDYTANSQPDDLPSSITPEQTYDAVTTELKYYQAQLENLVAKAGYNVNDEIVDRQILKLPDDFKVKHLQDAGFDPVLSVDEVALLLGYLREKQYIPEFRDSDLGEIAIIFGRSKQTVRTAYARLNDQKDETYKPARVALRTRLQGIIDDINGELQPTAKS